MMQNRGLILIGSLLITAATLTACGGKSTIVFGGGPPAVHFTVNTTDDTDDGACTASNCSLREAIHAANTSPGFNGIYFNIPGSGVHIINTNIGFPEITDPVVIDATTQPGYSGTPLIELRSSWAQHQTALSVHGGSSTIQGFSIVDFNIGVEIKDNTNVWVVGNYIGVQPDGVTAEGNDYAVEVWSGENHIGGTQLAYRNVISGNTSGIEINCQSDKNQIQNNFIGLNPAGSSAVANATYGIHLCGKSNTVGGTDALAGNVISGNTGNGVEIQAASGAAYPATGNQLVHNLIGTDATGMNRVGNGQNGVFITADGAILSGNTISGNLNGVLIDGHQGTLLTGNFIGVNSAGSAFINNVGCGILLHNASNNWIGGGGAGAGNVISGNMNAGIKIAADAGAAATANGIQGNKIGTNAGGTAEIANQAGIYIIANGNLIGGPSLDARNIISGNFGDGIRIQGSSNVVQNNYIGTDVSGTNPLGNQYNGVRLEGGASKNSIGTDTAGNFIAFNVGPGVALFDDAGDGNLIQFNSIHDNGGLGIQLGNSAAPLPNDPGDADTGPNQLQNYPNMISAISMFNSQFKASLNAAPGTAYRVDFFTNNTCDPSGYGEGQRWIKTVSVTTNISGMGLAIADFPSTYFADGNFITATATDPSGNTSEFSNCIPVVQATPTPNGTLTPTLTPTLTLPSKAKPFFSVKLSAPKIYYRGTGCGDKQEKFEVQVAEPAKVAGVWLFVRLKNKDGDGNTNWGEALVMIPEGSGWYSYTLLSENIPGFVTYKDAYIQYQLVAYDKSFAHLATSDVLWDVELLSCGTVLTGPG
jgi:CSLREA domain-containing protein